MLLLGNFNPRAAPNQPGRGRMPPNPQRRRPISSREEDVDDEGIYYPVLSLSSGNDLNLLFIADKQGRAFVPYMLSFLV